MFCKSCGKKIADDARFCPSCGVRQDVEEVVIAGSDSRQESEENTPTNLDDTPQSQSLDTSDAPSGTKEKKNAAANKQKPLIVVLKVILVVLIGGIIGLLYQNLTGKPLFFKAVEVSKNTLEPCPKINSVDLSDATWHHLYWLAFKGADVWNYYLEFLNYSGDSFYSHIPLANFMMGFAEAMFIDCEALQDVYRERQLREWLEEQRNFYTTQYAILKKYCSKSFLGYDYYDERKYEQGGRFVDTLGVGEGPYVDLWMVHVEEIQFEDIINFQFAQ